MPPRHHSDSSSDENQRKAWDALKKSINELVNEVTATNIKDIIPKLFAENLIRGRGLLCQSCITSQMASPGSTDVFAALVAVVNTKFPKVGDLLLRRIILQLSNAYNSNDKPQLLATLKFIAHLVNQRVVNELIALKLLTMLLEEPTDDSVEVAVGFAIECGSLLQDLRPEGLEGIFKRLCEILHKEEGDTRDTRDHIHKFRALQNEKSQKYPAIRPELDLVEKKDQLTHEVSLLDEIDPETALNDFKRDPQFSENEKQYEELKKQLLGDKSEEEVLRRIIYLTIMSSVYFEKAGYKLLNIKLLEPGQEMELCTVLLECCSQEKTYLSYYGLLVQRFCMINEDLQKNFEERFLWHYSMTDELEKANKLPNVAKFFAHLLSIDALQWHVLAEIRLTQKETTSSGRNFITILFKELSEHLGISSLDKRLRDTAKQHSFESSIFPRDEPLNTRFAINFFNSIGLGEITTNLQEYLSNVPGQLFERQTGVSSGSDSDNVARERKRRRR